MNTPKDLVLVGGGHAHVYVLKSFGSEPMPGVRVTVVTRDVEVPYSGMLPGFVAGHYTYDQCHIDLDRLARFSGARLIRAEATGLDLSGKQVICANRAPVAYDLLSIDIGSTQQLSSIRGAAGHATPVKPISRFTERWEEILQRLLASDGRTRFLTVGGGAAGVELTLAMRHRVRRILRACGRDADTAAFTLVTRSELLSTHNPSVRGRFRRLLSARGVAVIENSPVSEVGSATVRCANGEEIGFDELLLVTQGGAAPWLAQTGLLLDADGFIKIDATLRSLNGRDVFAAGDVASNVQYPRPKAGVFAVRQGPPLAENLRRCLVGKAPAPFVPQRNFLSLISAGNHYAVASRGAWAAQGKLLWYLKDWIDRRWMEQYQKLPARTADDAAGRG